MTVAVVGGGVVGLCCAWSLRQRGADVVVLERDRCGAAASLGNAGWVTPGLSPPIPAPGVLRQAARWMLDGESPLLVRPRLRPDFLSWCVRFGRSCTPARHRAGAAATLALALDAPRHFDELRAAGVAFEMHEQGLLYVTTSAQAIEAWIDSYTLLEELGFDGAATPLDGHAARRLEPALGEEVAGALLASRERHVRPESLTGGLVRALRAAGVEVLEGHDVSALRALRGGWRLDGAGATVEVEQVLVAAGAWTRRVLAPLGVRVPLEAAKGYSVTSRGSGTTPSRPLYLSEIKVGVSPFEGATRLAGTLELAGLDVSIDHRRLGAVTRGAERYLADWRPGPDGVEWAGLRPLPPDGLPIVGAVPRHRGLYVATGHGMLGVTLAPSTGEALAPLVLDGELVPALAPLGLDRFARRGSRQSLPDNRPASSLSTADNREASLAPHTR